MRFIAITLLYSDQNSIVNIIVLSMYIHVLGQFFPNATDASDLCLAAELALGPNLPSDARHFAPKYLELGYHGVDLIVGISSLFSWMTISSLYRLLEGCNLRVHLNLVYQDLVVKITIRHVCDNTPNLFERFLESFIGLLMFEKFSLKLADILMFDIAKGSFGELFLLAQPIAHIRDCFLLLLNLFGLLPYMVSNMP